MDVADRLICKAKRKGWREHPELNKWVEGSLVTGVFFTREGDDIYYILNVDGVDYDCFEDLVENEGNGEHGYYEVDPETICYCTGMEDWKKHRIFENDIIEFEDTGEEGYEYREGFDYINRAVVYWDKMMYTLDKFRYSGNSGVEDFVYTGDVNELYSVFTGSEVIGNKFDNPELLEEV